MADIQGTVGADILNGTADAGQNRTEIWVDANDDGTMSEVDMVIYLNGVTTLTVDDLADNFLVWRGNGGNDTYTGNALANTAYGMAGKTGPTR